MVVPPSAGTSIPCMPSRETPKSDQALEKDQFVYRALFLVGVYNNVKILLSGPSQPPAIAIYQATHYLKTFMTNPVSLQLLHTFLINASRALVSRVARLQIPREGLR